MFAPGRPSSISARTGLPLLRPGSRSRMSKCASSVISPISSSAPPSPSSAGPGDRIVAADQQGQRMRLRARRDRVADAAESPARWSDRRASTSPRSSTMRLELAAGLDVVAADPPQRPREAVPAQDRSAPGVTDPAASGAPSSPTGASRCARRNQLGKIGPARHRFDRSKRRSPKGKSCGTGCSSTATSRRSRNRRAIRSG